MLEKFMFCDAHFHFSESFEKNAYSSEDDITGCTSCHSLSDIMSVPDSLIKSFGIHPQNPDKGLLPVLENLLKENKIQAVGECGFDFFNEDFKSKREDQKTVFEAQLELALCNNLPLVIHGRKANEVLFSYAKELKKLPSVLFHSFMGSYVEASSFISRGLNCYFSFGKQIFNGNKKVIELVSRLPLEHILLETDAPYQTLKGEKVTCTGEIKKIYEGAWMLKKESLELSEKNSDFTGYCMKLENNFKNMYRI